MEKDMMDNVEDTNEAQPLRGLELIRQRELDELRRLEEEELREREEEQQAGENTLERLIRRVDKTKEMVLIDCTGSIVRVFDNLAQACLYFEESSHYLLEHIVTHRQIHGRMLLERREHFESWITNTPITFEADEDPSIHYAKLDSNFKERCAPKKNGQKPTPNDDRRTIRKGGELGGYRNRSGCNFRRSDFFVNEEGKECLYQVKRVRRIDTGEEYQNMNYFAKAIGISYSTVYNSAYKGRFLVKGIKFELLPPIKPQT